MFSNDRRVEARLRKKNKKTKIMKRLDQTIMGVKEIRTLPH